MAVLRVTRHGRGVRESLDFEALRMPWERLRGLLLTRPDAHPVALLGCGRIHTFGMRYRIDVAFVGASGLVLDVWRSVPPGQLLGDERARMTLERPHGRGPWLVAGETVETVLLDGGVLPRRR